MEPDNRMRTMARTVLEWRGYHIVEADSSSLALTIWPSQAAKVDMLLTELALPGGMSGRELADELCKCKPTLKVLFSCDTTKNSNEAQHLSEQQLVAKPFTSVELLERVSEFLPENS